MNSLHAEYLHYVAKNFHELCKFYLFLCLFLAFTVFSRFLIRWLITEDEDSILAGVLVWSESFAGGSGEAAGKIGLDAPNKVKFGWAADLVGSGTKSGRFRNFLTRVSLSTVNKSKNKLYLCGFGYQTCNGREATKDHKENRTTWKGWLLYNSPKPYPSEKRFDVIQ